MSLWAMLMECKKCVASPILFMMSEASEWKGSDERWHGHDGVQTERCRLTKHSAAQSKIVKVTVL